MVWKAKIVIDDNGKVYNPGDELPADKAEIWDKMYVESPVIYFYELPKKEEVIPEVKEEPIKKKRKGKRK